jgi:hypothetical protein
MTPRTLYAVPLVCLALASCGADPGGSAASPDSSSVPSTTSSDTTTTAPTASATASVAASPPKTSAATAKPSPPAAKAIQVTALAPVPRAGAEPAVRFPANEPAVGAGANASIARVPDSVWNRMVGFSWTEGCPVGRAQLRYVRVNFWGFDGKRSRGAIVVNASIADETAAAFTRLYSLQFRIRQMRPMDSTWGKNPKGPGANDYAAMDADNTSAFNCRYVGGAEASKVYSKHAYGTAIDVNDFENPYVADDGTVYPGRYFLSRRGPAPGVFSSSGSAAVRAFTSQGLRWGGLWNNPDYQLFDR